MGQDNHGAMASCVVVICFMLASNVNELEQHNLHPPNVHRQDGCSEVSVGSSHPRGLMETSGRMIKMGYSEHTTAIIKSSFPWYQSTLAYIFSAAKPGTFSSFWLCVVATMPSKSVLIHAQNKNKRRSHRAPVIFV
jgi:hypothetical protein